MRFLNLKTISSQQLSFLLALFSLLILMITLIMEYFFKVPVCRMCLLERYPYLAAAIVGLLAYFFTENSPLHPWFKYCLILVFLISTGLSFYHIGLEYGWFNLPSFCKESSPKLETVEALRDQILNQKTIIPCNVVPLRIFFLSLA